MGCLVLPDHHHHQDTGAPTQGELRTGSTYLLGNATLVCDPICSPILMNPMPSSSIITTSSSPVRPWKHSWCHGGICGGSWALIPPVFWHGNRLTLSFHSSPWSSFRWRLFHCWWSQATGARDWEQEICVCTNYTNAYQMIFTVESSYGAMSGTLAGNVHPKTPGLTYLHLTSTEEVSGCSQGRNASFANIIEIYRL